jgi:hypothetical protein
MRRAARSSAWARNLLYVTVGGDPEAVHFEELSLLLDEAREQGRSERRAADALRAAKIVRSQKEGDAQAAAQESFVVFFLEDDPAHFDVAAFRAACRKKKRT